MNPILPDQASQRRTKSSSLPFCETWRNNLYLIPGLLFALHLLIALSLKSAFAFRLLGSWDLFLQSIPTERLMQHPLSSIWFLHSQPPIFNLVGALLMRLFFPYHLQALHYLWIILGALSVAMAYVITLSFSKSTKLSLVIALYFAFHPSLFLYEAFLLYDILTIFETTMLVFLLSLYHLNSSTTQNNLGYLIAFMTMFALLVLTRSLYHLLLLIPCLVLVCVLAGKRRKQILVIGIICSLLPMGWYVKNYQQVGVMGSSSWLGLNLWRIAVVGYSEEELHALAQQGIIDKIVAEVKPFSKPSAYIAYGLDKQTDNEEWARDDFNNINIPQIAKLYQTNSIKLIEHNPRKYLQAASSAFLIFCDPASKFSQLTTNVAKLGWLESFYADILQGHYLFRLVGIPGSALVILLPFTLILYTTLLVRQCGFSPHRWSSMLHLDAPMLFCAGLIVYTLIIGCFLEYGENERFKFGIEIPLWIFIITTLYRRYVRPPLIPAVEAEQTSHDS